MTGVCQPCAQRQMIFLATFADFFAFFAVQDVDFAVAHEKTLNRKGRRAIRKGR
jgi:hypothetical protein